MALREREHARAAAALHHPAQHVEFRFRIGRPFGHDLQEPGTRVAHAHGDAGQLVLLRAEGRRRIALQCLVAQAARGGKAERSRAHRLGGDLAHLGDVRLVGILQRDRPIAHDEHAHGGVRQQRGNVDVAVAPLQGAKILGERLPLPGQTFMHDRARDVLHALHQLDQLFAVRRPAWGEAHAAIAHHRGGDAVHGRRRHVAVPHRLPVVVRVDVDEAGCHQLALGVNLLGAVLGQAADRGDAAALDTDISLDRSSPSAVNHRATANDQIEFRCHALISIP